MARRRKDAGADANETEAEDQQAKPSEVRKVITARALKGLLADARAVKKDVDELVNGHREQIANAVEKQHLDKDVFGTLKKLDRKEPEKLRTWLDTFEYYLDISGLKKRADSVTPMQFGPGEEGDGEEESGAQPARGNVRAFPAPGSVTAE